ncbi:MAG: dTMP kinase [bacterium]|nr:dTMP kinase [bacterium]
MNKKGKFIVFEGGEGSGKTSAQEYLKKELSGHKIVFTREPGGTPTAEQIRDLVISRKVQSGDPLDERAEMGLFCSARIQHIERLIQPTLAQGIHVICDRFSASTYAYQVFASGRKDLEGIFYFLDKIFRGAKVQQGKLVDGLEPDLYILMDIDPVIGLGRSMRRGDTNKFEDKLSDFHERVRDGLFAYLSSKPHCVIDASRDHKKVLEEVYRVVCTTLFSEE